MAVIVMATQGVIYSLVALGAGALHERLRGSEQTQHALSRGVGALLIVDALWTLAHALGW